MTGSTATADPEVEAGPMATPVGGARILVIDDDPGVASMLRLVAEEHGYQLLVAADGPAGLAMARGEAVDLILLDLNLPGLHGIELCRRLRAAGVWVPVMIVSCELSTVDVVVGLEVGADDYVRKPFQVRELVARINAHLRRTRPAEGIDPPQRLQFPGLAIDLGRHEVWRDGRPIALTPIEFRILTTLAAQAGSVVSRQHLIEQVWRRGERLEVRSLDAHVYRLRRKVEPEPHLPTYLHAVIGVGYRFEHRPPRHATPYSDPEPGDRPGSG